MEHHWGFELLRRFVVLGQLEVAWPGGASDVYRGQKPDQVPAHLGLAKAYRLKALGSGVPAAPGATSSYWTYRPGPFT